MLLLRDPNVQKQKQQFWNPLNSSQCSSDHLKAKLELLYFNILGFYNEYMSLLF